MERGSPDRRRFFASLFAGQFVGVLALLLLGGVLAPVLLAFMGAAAGCFVVAEPRGERRAHPAEPGASPYAG